MGVFFRAVFQETDSLYADFNSVIEVDKDIDPYLGPYSAVPAVYDQVFATKQKTMMDDFTVEEIPYAETSNNYGTTVIIAS